MGNSIHLDFTNTLLSEFTLGNLNDGFSTPTLSQDMLITSSVAAPLVANSTQTLSIEQEVTLVDRAKAVSIAGSAIANPSGNASVAVVWTSYPLRLRFGILAEISSTRGDAVAGVAASMLSLVVGTQLPGPSPTISWSYLLDATPDATGTWVQPAELTAPVTASCPDNSGFQLSIKPTVGETSLNIECHIQTAF